MAGEGDRSVSLGERGGHGALQPRSPWGSSQGRVFEVLCIKTDLIHKECLPLGIYLPDNHSICCQAVSRGNTGSCLYHYYPLSICVLILIFELFVLFITCIIYTRADFSISKSSAAYLAKLQWDELEASLRDLSRTGDIQTCKASRKSTDSLLKDLSKELRPFLASLQSLPSASQISPKVEELVSKEKELQEKLMAKHTTVVEGYEKK
uniref:Uncharacterized protein n=1 Tax=Brassica campestris TaxID=3711 RepID=M4CHN9_BRACM